MPASLRQDFSSSLKAARGVAPDAVCGFAKLSQRVKPLAARAKKFVEMRGVIVNGLALIVLTQTQGSSVSLRPTL